MDKFTMKEQVLQFVESQGSASYTEIQKFIVDTKYGAGTYGSRPVEIRVWNCETQTQATKTRMMNPYRGYYASAFSAGRYSKHTNRWIYGGYFLRSSNRLVKGDDGKYSTIREHKNK